jgi:hypothetical protein
MYGFHEHLIYHKTFGDQFFHIKTLTAVFFHIMVNLCTIGYKFGVNFTNIFQI